MKECPECGKDYYERKRGLCCSANHHGIRYELIEPKDIKSSTDFIEDKQRFKRQKALFEKRYKDDIASGEMEPWEELTPETQASVCEECGEFADPEMPFENGDVILCGGDECRNSQCRIPKL